MGQLIFILSGQREVGKTTFLKHLLAAVPKDKIDCAGLLSPAVFENGQKTGIDLLDLRGGTLKKLASLRKNENDGLFTERWLFDAEVMRWGNEILAQATPCDLLIVDELGPIELERGQGWQAGITSLSTGTYRVGIVVIRPELLAPAFALWPKAQLIEIKQGQETGSIQSEILAALQ